MATLTDILTPLQFRTTILVTSGLKNHEIAEFLGTTEHTVKNILRDTFDRLGIYNRVELALRFVHDSEHALIDRRFLKSELVELESRASQILHARPLDAVRHDEECVCA